MEPYQNQRGTKQHPDAGSGIKFPDNTPGASGSEPTPENPDRDAPDGSGNPPATDRQPQYSGGFTVIPPNESRRNNIRMIAQKEEEALQRWREENKPPPVHVKERLGGNATLAAARDRQLAELRSAKLQKKLKKEEFDRRKRQEEEEELQKMKDEQREKAERLQKKRQQEEQRRREQLSQDHTRRTEKFLQRFESTDPRPLASSSATLTSSRSEAVESKQESTSGRDVQLEHRRVNSAFLDKLEGRGSEKETKEEAVWEVERPFMSTNEDTPRNQLPVVHLNPDPEQGYYDWTDEAGPEPDVDWALMRLMSSYPDFSKVFLEDILDQCNSDYDQAYTLLDCTLN
ncbi:epithelial-stromal interaction protein 1 [Etheostoma cragini]|uniref:epithelial-stromal interaction protein 1 n=1 Tax=Etheostoma cragini TaxID=417921 RepID=UPI00155E88CA|nr:epithelial-stromal interaction protein 1 [Etheostoma cragini]